MNRKGPSKISPVLYPIEGRIPPQAVEIEQAVLGAMLMEPRCIDNALSILREESFYCPENQTIFSAIKSLKGQCKAVDLLTVTDFLKVLSKLDEIGGPVYLSRLTSLVASSSHAEMHSRIVQDKYILRELIRLAFEILSQAYGETEDPLDIISMINSFINNLLSENQNENAEPLSDLLKSRIKEYESISLNKGKLLGIPSGLVNLDRITTGWQNSDLIIIAARPSQGKTAFSLFTGLQSSSFGSSVAFFSLEMSKPQLVDRALSAVTNISPIRLRSGNLADYEWEQLDFVGIRKLETLPFHIDDTPALSLAQLRAKVLQLRRRHKIGLVMIDYLQLMRGEGRTREEEISSISRGLKALAKEVNIPIIALSQLNRQADGKRPVLANLRESGAIEQDADMVIFIHRPEKYGQTTDENGRSTKGLVELIIDKHRNGPTGLIECWTNDFCTMFTDDQNAFQAGSLRNFTEPAEKPEELPY